MATKKQAKTKDTAPEAPLPFDEVVKRLLRAPPQHRVAKKKAVKKK